MIQAKLIQAVKSHALRHYEADGWDYVVECYGDEEIAVILNEEAAVTVSKAIKAVGKVAKHYDDLRKEIQATAF